MILLLCSKPSLQMPLPLLAAMLMQGQMPVRWAWIGRQQPLRLRNRYVVSYLDYRKGATVTLLYLSCN